MPRNDLSDSKSIRGQDDPRRSLKAMQQETELKLGAVEAGQTGGVEHQDRLDREGVPREKRPVEAATRDVSRATRQQDDSDRLRVPSGEGSGRERAPTPETAAETRSPPRRRR